MLYKNKRIVIIGPSLKMGGMESASVTMANALNSEGVETTFISFFSQIHFFKLNDGISLIEPVKFNIKKIDFWKSLIWIRKMIVQINPDRIIVFNKLYSAITCLSLVMLKFPIYISERSSPLYEWPKMQRILMNIIFRYIKPTGVISQTNIAQLYQKNYYGKKVRMKVIPNVIREIEKYTHLSKKKCILAVGRLNDPLKGFDRLINAFSKIERAGWVLNIAGGIAGEDACLDALIHKFGLESKVNFLGKVSNIDKLYAESSIFVIPSRSEGFPNALAEAMCSGMPCISFDFVAGPRDIITHMENGMIVEDGNIEELTKAIIFLIDNQDVRERLGKKAELLVEKVSSAVVTHDILNYLFDHN